MRNNLKDIYHSPKILKRCRPRNLLNSNPYIIKLIAKLPSMTVYIDVYAESPIDFNLLLGLSF